MKKSELIYIVEEAKNGSKKAFETLYNEYSDRVYFFVLKNVGREDVAEDITHDTFLKSMEKIHTLEKPENYLTWIHSIAYNKCADMFRSESRSTYFDSEEEQEAVMDNLALNEPVMVPEDHATNRDTARQLMSIIDGLKPDMKSAVIMYYYDDMSAAEVGKALGLNQNAVKQKLFQARKKLRAEIEKLQQQGVAMCAVPMGRMLHKCVSPKYAAAAKVSSSAAVSGGLVAGKAAAAAAAVLLIIGIPVGLHFMDSNKNGSTGDTRILDSSANLTVSHTNDSSLTADITDSDGEVLETIESRPDETVSAAKKDEDSSKSSDSKASADSKADSSSSKASTSGNGKSLNMDLDALRADAVARAKKEAADEEAAKKEAADKEAAKSKADSSKSSGANIVTTENRTENTTTSAPDDSSKPEEKKETLPVEMSVDKMLTMSPSALIELSNNDFELVPLTGTQSQSYGIKCKAFPSYVFYAPNYIEDGAVDGGYTTELNGQTCTIFFAGSISQIEIADGTEIGGISTGMTYEQIKAVKGGTLTVRNENSFISVCSEVELDGHNYYLAYDLTEEQTDRIYAYMADTKPDFNIMDPAYVDLSDLGIDPVCTCIIGFSDGFRYGRSNNY
ncbi:RNA polymerase sigma factor [Ruminococcus sp.]|uniref:RNA polymerase sigma factor n=1 Tax=Ruminococcus sp. TaxID=41978 RepID=UPI0025EE5FD8|nr:RNA polymerase sigma factor [Ruminococcus sp.]MBQ8967004.1 RNA polymerase sigma factor [Ruminococcus sp.]